MDFSTERSFDFDSLKIFKRGDIVKVNLGFNVGKEMGGLHYCVVINKYDNNSSGTLNVIPLTSKKEHDPKWIDENKNVIVDLGIIDGYPEECKECYACTFMLQSVSKKRLSRYGDDKQGYFDIKLSDDQMQKICINISEIAYNKVDKVLDKDLKA